MALNKLQLSVADDLDNHILLMASAGTGKTNTLAHRISNIIEQGRAKPEEILCLTFTNKACTEMRERIVQLAGEAASDVVVRTFHSFCYDLIRAEAKGETDISWDFQVFDETDSQQLMDMAMARFNLERVDTPGFTPLKWPEQIYRSLVSHAKLGRAEKNVYTGDAHADYKRVIAEQYENNVNDITRMCWDKRQLQENIPSEYYRWGAKLLVAYDNLLKENHGLDFNDLVIIAHQLLQRDNIQKVWSQRFEYICIDEVQDTSKLEYDIIQRIFGDSVLLLSGDFFQTIYQWRGSDPLVIMDKFKMRYKPRKVVFLENYRATRLLVNASFAVLCNIFTDRVKGFYPDGIRAVSKEKGLRIKLYPAFDMYAEARWLYKELHSRYLKEGESFLHKVCILNRTNTQNLRFAQMFDEIGKEYKKPLPFMLVDDFKFFRRQEIKDGMAFLRLILNPHDVGSMKRIVSRFVKGVGKASLDVLDSASYRQSGVKLTDFIDPVTQQYGDPYFLLVDQLHEGNIVVFDVESTGLDTAKDEIIQLAAIKIDIDGKLQGKFVKYLRAQRRVGLSERVHHISDEKLRREGEEPKRVLSEFVKFAQGCVIVGHNVSYDMAILISQLKRLQLGDFQPLAVYDTLDIFRRFYPDLPNHKLEYLGEFCKVQHKSTHDAFDDISATAEILLYAVHRNIRPTAELRHNNISRLLNKFQELSSLISQWRHQMTDDIPLRKLLGNVLTQSGVVNYYKSGNVESEEKELRSNEGRVENLRQLIRHARIIEKEYISTKDAMEGFLKLASLSNTEIELMLKENPRIPILTVHQVKGSEFDYVYIAECQEGVFPNRMSIDQGQLAEEGRLFYVSITRAKKELTISYAVTNRNSRDNRPSRYISAIPDEYVQKIN